MHTASHPRQHTAPTARPPSLLGAYPVPELHLVGAPVPDNPRSPLQWQPTPPPLQYGIDYTFTHRTGREPVRWQHNSAITVRIAGPSGPDRSAALAIVVAELRVLTPLNLITGEPTPTSLISSAVPDGEIHVRYLAAGKFPGLPGRHVGQAGLGGAARCPAGCCYVNGFAIINADLAGRDATTEHALAILRHELGHALGLGHAARPSLLMHPHIAAGTTHYRRGDRHGLALLGLCAPCRSPAAPNNSHLGTAGPSPEGPPPSHRPLRPSSASVLAIRCRGPIVT